MGEYKSYILGSRRSAGRFFSVAWEYIKGVWDVAVLYFTLIWENIKVVFSAVGEVLGSFFATRGRLLKRSGTS